MTLLYIGLVLWIAAHLFKRVAPAARAKLGDKGKGPVAIVLLISVVLMIIGYRAAEVDNVYTPMAGMGHVNNALMLVSLFFFGIGGTKGVLYPKIRHPMLWGTVIWAVAHLLVNGDCASVVLFGGIGAWALVSMLLINAANGPWTPPTGGRGIKGDAMNLVGTLVLYGIAVGIHIWLGHPTFLGTYS